MVICAAASGAGADYRVAVGTLAGGGGRTGSATYNVFLADRERGLQAIASPGYRFGEGFLRCTTGYAILSPLVTGIDPNSSVNRQTVSVTVSGANFAAGASVKLTASGEAGIFASDVVVVNAGRITGVFDVRGAAVGDWDVTVTNADGRSGTLPLAFKIRGEAPTIASITPNKGLNNEIVSITDLAGTNFQPGATVKLTKINEPDLAADRVTVVSGIQITCGFNLNGRAPGSWNAVVINKDGQAGMLADGFKIEAPNIEITIPVTSSKNPFNPLVESTVISYGLSKDADIEVDIFNAYGQRVWSWTAPAGSNGGRAGLNEILWNGVNAFRELAHIGVYLVHVVSKEKGSVKTISRTRIVVVK